MLNRDRGNNFYNKPYTPILPNNYLYRKSEDLSKDSPNNYNRAISPYSTNTQNYNNRNAKSPNYKYLNNKKTNDKLNLPNNNNYSSVYNSPSSSNSYSSNTPNYFSPMPKKNIQSINVSNLNLKINNKNPNPNSPLYSFQNKNNNNDNNSNKKTLILDLDETLVHSGFHPFNRKSDFTFNINVDGKDHTIFALKRPYVDEFLSEISPYYEIIIFTASISQYASPLIDLVDKNKKVSGRMFREHCLFNHGLYLKDLKSIGKNLKDMIIIDNNPVSYVLNQDNGIPILTWYEDLNDKELINLIPLLKYLSTVDDVRPIIKKIVDRQNNKIDFYSLENLIKNKINENENYKEMIYNSNNNNKPNKNINNLNDEFSKKNNNYIKNYEVKTYNNENINLNTNSNKNIRNNINMQYQNNKFRNYLDNDNLFKYNNNIHDSLSNMSYNEIQNEGNNNVNNKNYNSNNYNIQKSNSYYQYKNNNNFNEDKKHIPNVGNQREITPSKKNNNNNLTYNFNFNYQNNINIKTINNENENKNNLNEKKNTYTNRSYTPNLNQHKRPNSFFGKEKNANVGSNSNNRFYPYKQNEMIGNKKNINTPTINRQLMNDKNNIYNNKNSNNNYNSRPNNENIKTNNYLIKNDNYLESLINEQKGEDNYNNYLKSYQQYLINTRSRANSYNYNYSYSVYNNNININNIKLYSNKNSNPSTSYLTPNYNNAKNLNNNRNNSIANTNYRRNTDNNSIYNNGKFDAIRNRQNEFYRGSPKINKNNNFMQETNLSQNNFIQSYKNRNDDINFNNTYQNFYKPNYPQQMNLRNNNMWYH